MSILCYHAVQPGWTAPMSIEPTTFAAHATWLDRRRRVLPLSTAVQRLGPRATLRGRDAALTFDDGFASVHEHAFPLLRRLHLPATVFLVARTLQDPETPVDWVDHPPAEPLQTLTLDQILEMQTAGVSFESHSLGHLDLTSLSYAQCVEDLRRSKEILEDHLRRPVTLLAYPRGRHDADVRAAAARAGYTHAFTLPEGPEEPGPYSVPRVGIYYANSVTHLRIKSAAPYLGVRATLSRSGR